MVMSLVNSKLKWSLGLLALCASFSTVGAPLIIDRTSVALYTNLTAADIARVKTLWVDIPGASHSLSYRVGCQLLENLDAQFQVNVTESGTPEGITTNYLRISRAFRNQYNQWDYGSGEGYWYTISAGVENPLRTISYANTNALEIAAMGFGWSWQPTWHNLPGGGIDPVHQVRWAGASEGGPDGDLRWGLDDSSFAVTSNRISVDTYLQATQQYIEACKSNHYNTKVFFTTGPPDGDGGNGESAYQRHLKYEHIRNYVKATTDGVLFDYADILCASDSGELSTIPWTDYGGTPHTIPEFHADNYKNFDGSDGSGSPYHFGERGALRIGKALWVMLAQMSAPAVAIPVAPVLEVSRNTPGVVQVQFTASSNAVHTLQFSTNLASDIWQPLASLSSQPYERTILFLDHTDTATTNCFYRVAMQPVP